MAGKKIENKPASAYAKQGLVPHTAGYPNNIKNTQTVKVRGTGAQTKGDKCSTRLA